LQIDQHAADSVTDHYQAAEIYIGFDIQRNRVVIPVPVPVPVSVSVSVAIIWPAAALANGGRVGLAKAAFPLRSSGLRRDIREEDRADKDEDQPDHLPDMQDQG
jgi:hypothetical protein